MKKLLISTLLVLLTFSSSYAYNLNKALMKAASKGKIEQVKLLLKNGANPNVRTSARGKTALIYAACYGHIKVVKLLLDHNASIDMSDSKARTPLIWATCYNHFDVVKLLLDRGANVNLQDYRHRTAMIYSLVKGYDKISKILADHGASVEVKKQESSSTRMMRDAREGLWNSVHMSIKNGVDPNAYDKFNNTILMYAVYQNRVKTVKLLLENGADPNLQNRNYGHTALMEASGRGNLEIVKLLLDHNADPNIENIRGYSAVSFACVKKHVDVIKLLEQYESK